MYSIEPSHLTILGSKGIRSSVDSFESKTFDRNDNDDRGNYKTNRYLFYKIVRRTECSLDARRSGFEAAYLLFNGVGDRSTYLMGLGSETMNGIVDQVDP